MKKNKGFTLIELLVVIAIIGILSSVVLASLNSARKKGRDAARVSSLKELQVSLELYFDTNGKYPVLLTDLVTGGFIPVEPKDPLNKTSYPYVAYTGAISATTVCTGMATCTGYHIGANLEATGSTTDSDADNVQHTAGVNGADTAGCAGETGRVCYDLIP